MHIAEIYPNIWKGNKEQIFIDEMTVIYSLN